MLQFMRYNSPSRLLRGGTIAARGVVQAGAWRRARHRGTGTGVMMQVNTAGNLDHIVISPASATINLGSSQAYTAHGFDASNNSLGEVTPSTVFSIGPNESFSGSVRIASVGGPH